MEFRSPAVLSLVELHERELRSFLALWDRFVASGLPVPEANGDENYENRDRLLGHVLMAARGYLTRIGEWVGRPVSDVDASKDPYDVAGRAPAFADNVLAGYRTNLPAITIEEFAPQLHKTRWGDLMSVENLLEHAVVHPMRHRRQLERLLEAGKR